MSSQPGSAHNPVCGVILGPSGSGKGYCAGKVFTRFHGVHVFVTGDWCRDKLPELAANGILVDDAVVNSTVESHFRNHADHYYAVDAPRSLAQAEFFINMFRARFPRGRIVAFHVDATHDESFAMIRHRAIREQRLDDAKPKAVEKRLKAYFGSQGIQEVVVPYLKMQCGDDFVTIKHNGFTDPLAAPMEFIDEVVESTRQYVRKHVAPEYFVRTVGDTKLSPSQVA